MVVQIDEEIGTAIVSVVKVEKVEISGNLPLIVDLAIVERIR